MSIKGIPLLIISFFLYNAIVFFGGDASGAHSYATIFIEPLFSLSMARGGEWVFTTGDLIMMLSLILLGGEIIKATYTRHHVLTDHALSMLLCVVCIIEFILVPQAATSLFFMITMMTGIDVIAGAFIGIRTARRDFGMGSDIT